MPAAEPFTGGNCGVYVMLSVLSLCDNDREFAAGRETLAETGTKPCWPSYANNSKLGIWMYLRLRLS